MLLAGEWRQPGGIVKRWKSWMLFLKKRQHRRQWRMLSDSANLRRLQVVHKQNKAPTISATAVSNGFVLTVASLSEKKREIWGPLQISQE